MYNEILSALEANLEQRRKPRYRGNFPAVIQGADEYGKRFEEPTMVENISACGLYLSTQRFFVPEKPITVILQLSESPSNGNGHKSYLETEGMIVRVDILADKRYGVAVDIQRYSFL